MFRLCVNVDVLNVGAQCVCAEYVSVCVLSMGICWVVCVEYVWGLNVYVS